MRRLNKTLVIGMSGGLMLVLGAIAYEINGLNAAVFIHPVALLIVLGGSLCAAMISLPFEDLKRVFKRTYYSIFYPKNDFGSALRDIVKTAIAVNKDLLALDKEAGATKNSMLRDGLQFISMGYKLEDIKRVMEIKREQNESALAECSLLFFSIGKMGPAFGLLGTLVGLIILLYYHMGEGNMEKVASSMGVALTATLYGVGLANLIFSPLGDYMQYTAERGSQLDRMIIEGVVQIKERRHPVYLIQSLKAYLPREDYGILDQIMLEETKSSAESKTSQSSSSTPPQKKAA